MILQISIECGERDFWLLSSIMILQLFSPHVEFILQVSIEFGGCTAQIIHTIWLTVSLLPSQKPNMSLYHVTYNL